MPSTDQRNLSSAGGVRLRTARALLVAVGLGAWFLTQALLQARQPAASAEQLRIAGQTLTASDGLIALTRPLYEWFTERPARSDGLLIVSSAAIDALGLFLLGWSVFGRSARPFLGLLMLFGLRQVSQVLCALPAPAGMIWEDPGFPSLLVTYSVANDFFFSGHTALAVYGAIELGRCGGKTMKALAVCLAVFLSASVIVLRAHYTMDVLAAVFAAVAVAFLAHCLAPAVDRGLEKLLGMYDGPPRPSP